jgi:hypothetical protein
VPLNWQPNAAPFYRYYLISHSSLGTCLGFAMTPLTLPDVQALQRQRMGMQRASLSAGCRTIMDRDLAQQPKTTASN